MWSISLRRSSCGGSGPGGVWRLAGVAVLAALLGAGCATVPDNGQLFREQLVGLPPHDGWLIPRVRDVEKGRERDGAAALEVMFHFWGIRMPRGHVKPLLLEQGAELGTIQEQMIHFADHQGLWSFASFGSMAELEARVSGNQPVVVILQEGSAAAFDRRYAVVVGFNRVTMEVVCHEGAGHPGVYSYAQFNRMWRPLRNWMLVICPPETAEWELSYLELASQARFYERRNRRHLALSRFHDALEREPKNLDLLLATGTAHRNLGQHREAERLYRDAVALNNMHARACNNLAYHLASHGGNLEEAEALARRAVMLEPSNPAILDTLGLVLWKLGDYDKAAEALERARVRSRNLSDASVTKIMLRLARVYVDAESIHLAVQVLDDLKRRVPGVSIPPDLAVYLVTRE
ncbi:MAG TPA: tetratricopeptide repeat protein [Kiritimatiellia bacterium]|nr:tetratricopeptide repeat protein [Kiritimatiellia bacterium]